MLAAYAARQPTRLSTADCDALATGCQTLEDSQHLSTDPLGALEDSCASEDAVLSHAMHVFVCIKSETQVPTVPRMAGMWQVNCSTLDSLYPQPVICTWSVYMVYVHGLKHRDIGMNCCIMLYCNPAAAQLHLVHSDMRHHKAVSIQAGMNVCLLGLTLMLGRDHCS